MNIVTDLDTVVEKRIQFFEQTYGCMISIFTDGTLFYMSVIAKDFSWSQKDIKLCKISDPKYVLIHSIREYFVR